MVDFVHCCAFMYYRQGELMHLKWQKNSPQKTCDIEKMWTASSANV